MIPKVIHYCWFGGNPLPETALRCIESWKKYCPGYEIKEWNEKNYDVNKITYMSEAYRSKKYAFVSDYVRFDILYKYGGIYFDTDVEVIKPIDKIIEKGAFFGMETVGTVNPGLGIAAFAGDPLYAEILESYEKSSFFKPNGKHDLTTIVERVTGILCKHGFLKENKIQLVKNINIYPIDYFNPKDPRTGIISITSNTYTIHHFDASWTTPLRKKYIKYSKFLIPKIGYIITNIILSPMRIMCILQEVGFMGLIKKFIGRY
ncbi:glycosyltransferase family 32 protein [Treponema denticola]|uniref:glycosyltransferase family 32 protein n=1 Tax=Treponema denticola TaxID=158 RepID=UPI0001FD36AA|nr:glycosyltransferase [Treponema denticola]EGC77193.1 glycosyltransferase [Treponema denticola F0402]